MVVLLQVLPNFLTILKQRARASVTVSADDLTGHPSAHKHGGAKPVIKKLPSSITVWCSVLGVN